MSASKRPRSGFHHDLANPRPMSPVLPPEIWLHVFRLFTEDPSSSLERYQLGPNAVYHHHWEETKGYRVSLADKLVLVRVCQGWNELATPLLYEHVSVTTDRQCDRVRKAFAPVGDAPGPNAETHAERSTTRRKLVRRLDLVYENPANALPVAIEFCALFPELTVLVASLGAQEGDMPCPMLHSLPQALEQLYWTHHKTSRSSSVEKIEKIPFANLVGFFDGHPHLKSVGIPYAFHPPPSSDIQSRAYRSKRWPSLCAIVFHHASQAKVLAAHLPSGAFPSIRKVNASYLQAETSRELQDFLSTHVKERLAVLSFRRDTTGGHNVVNVLHQLAESTTPVEVHLSPEKNDEPYRWCQRAAAVAKPSQVHVLGLHWVSTDRSNWRGDCHEIVAMHHLVCLPWTKVFPNLRTIRLMVGVDIDFYKAHDSLTDLSLKSPGRWVKNPIRVVDISGRLLADFSSVFPLDHDPTRIMNSVQAIPSEVWLQIFRFATEDSGSSPERIQLGPNTSCIGWKESAGYRSSLKTKSALVKTCRLWNAIATPLLYEHISVGSDHQYQRVLAGFKNDDHGFHLKNLVHRLDIVCEEEKKAMKMAIELCNLFPKLTTLVTSLKLRPEDDPKPLFDALSPLLEELYLLLITYDRRLEHIPLSHIVQLLDAHPKMVAISIPYRFCDTAEANNVDPTWRSKRWPSLRALVLQTREQANALVSYLPPKAFPNLRTVNGSWSGSAASRELQDVISPLVRRELVTLSMSLDPYPSFGGAPQLSSLLRQLDTVCPRLRTIHVWLTECKHPSELLGKLSAKAPLITTLAIHLPLAAGRYDSRHLPGRILQDMHQLAAMPWTFAFPNLTTIRLMEGVDVEEYKKHDDVTRQYLCVPGRYARYPIRVEDRDGQLLAQFTSGISTLVVQ
ncbi:hypothetical protein NMY22_g15913 [Coprinellus aureogranulatus]|nr:hypothetical protein NMY22_g15913 [Coprinellus aureogranulatus]